MSFDARASPPGSASLVLISRASRSGVSWSSGISQPPPRSATYLPLTVWWSSVAWGKGTMMAGSPAHESSARVMPPQRLTTSLAERYAQAMSSMKSLTSTFKPTFS